MPKNTDPSIDRAEQSRRFQEAALAIEADGGLSPDDAIKLLEKAMEGIRRRPGKSDGG